MGFLSRAICLLVGYVCGCVLTADFVSKRLAGKPVFALGDGNPGMANVGHCLGMRAAAYTLAGDLGKVVVATLIASLVFPGLGSAAVAWAGLGATLGHNYPFWHGFRGGKGVATTCATIVLASPVWGGLSCILGFVAVIASEYLCVGAVAIPAFFVLFMLIFGTADQAVVAAILLLLMLPQHLPAIREIRSGRTPRAGIAQKVRDYFRGSQAQALEPGSTTAWPAQHLAQATHEWRNASQLDRRLPVFEQHEQNEWAQPPASAFPSKPVMGGSHFEWPRSGRGTDGRHATKDTTGELANQTTANENRVAVAAAANADATVAREASAGIATTKTGTPAADGYRETPAAHNGVAPSAENTVSFNGIATAGSTTGEPTTGSVAMPEAAQPASIDPGSTAPMVIPQGASPLDESNPLQRALIQAHKHQEERRQEAIENARKAREQAAAQQETRHPTHGFSLLSHLMRPTHRRSSGATSA